MTPQSLNAKLSGLSAFSILSVVLLVALMPEPVSATSANLIYLSTNVNGSVSNADGSSIVYRNEDILTFDTGTGQWSLFFDGSDTELPTT